MPNSKVVVNENELFFKAKEWCSEQFKSNGYQGILSPELAYIEGYKAAIQSSTNHGTFSYLKSEQEFQIIAMRALGINYPENGYTFEQCINTVLFLAAQNKSSTKTFTLEDMKDAFDAGFVYAEALCNDYNLPDNKEQYIQSLSK